MSLFGLVSTKKLEEANREIESLKSTMEQLRRQLLPEYNTVEALNSQISELEDKKNICESELKIIKKKFEDLEKKYAEKSVNLIQLDDEILYQSFSLFRPQYDFANSEKYKQELERIRQEQKRMIKDKTAVTYFDNWTVDGSKAKGRKMTNDNIKMILRCFNTDCENAIDRVKFNNIDSMRARIQKSFDSLNKLNEVNRVSLTSSYLDLKFQELQLAIEYTMKKQEEKEEQKRIRQELREQAKLEKEIEEARKDIEKEKKHYSNALTKVNSHLAESLDDSQRQALLEKKAEIEGHLVELQKSLEEVDYRATNQKAGYVYIISNIGAFGEDVYKIGMTRRLEPMERVDELGDASVPFNFDVHAMIFCEDAPKLEAALHHAFEDRKLNMINTRREFFHVTLDQIEEVVKANYDKTVEFIRLPAAEQYRQSKLIWEELSQQKTDTVSVK